VTTAAEVREQLRDELRPLCRRPCTFTNEPSPIEGGFSSELFAFELAAAPAGLGGPLVLRLHAGYDSAAEDRATEDRAAVREQQVHLGVAELGFATPGVALVGDSTSAFGRPFTIMERLDGRPAVELHGLAALRAFREVPTLVAESMIGLHSLDASPVVARLVRAGIGDDQLGVDAMLDAIAAVPGQAESHEALERLRATRPREGRPVVVHGDLHALNLWRRPEGSIAVLDWEMATIGPAELDVARSALMLRLVPGELPRVARPMIMRLGRRAEAAFVANYGMGRDYDENALRWCTALHAVRLVTVVLMRPGSDRVAALWRPVGRQLADVVEQVTNVRVPVP
jgi:aminoglycoside phosphotransferase (APT) family kinase protein